MKLAIILIGLIGISGCAINSGVVPMGEDTYIVSRQAATGFTGMGSLKAAAFKESSEYCVSQNKKIQVVNTNESQPPYILGNFPRVELQFMCLKASDEELVRPKLQKQADVVIEEKKSIVVDVKEKDMAKQNLDMYSKLLKLEDLRERGIITKSEFEEQKKKILNDN